MSDSDIPSSALSDSIVADFEGQDAFSALQGIGGKVSFYFTHISG